MYVNCKKFNDIYRDMMSVRGPCIFITCTCICNFNSWYWKKDLQYFPWRMDDLTLMKFLWEREILPAKQMQNIEMKMIEDGDLLNGFGRGTPFSTFFSYAIYVVTGFIDYQLEM